MTMSIKIKDDSHQQMLNRDTVIFLREDYLPN